MIEPARDALLAETKRLLAALNDENRELKAENTRLLTQCRTATERAMRISAEKEGLEKDLKQINFNLMQQLRVKLATIKEQERQVLQLQDKASSLETQLQNSRLAQESSSKENIMQREQIVTLDSRLQQLTERLFRTEAEAGRYAEDLNTAIVGQRETTSKIQHESAQRLKHIEEALRISQTKEASLERVVEELRYELGRTKDILRQQYSNRKEGQRRSLSAHSEALYAHEQVLNSCSSSYQQLRELQQRVREVETLALDSINHMERVMREREARLQQQLENLSLTDETMLEFLCKGIMEREQELSVTREELTILQKEYQTQQITLASQEAQLQERESEVHALREALEAAREELQTRRRVENELQTELSHWKHEAQSGEQQAAECRRVLQGEREQSEATRRSYEREADTLDVQLQEFTSTVSLALRKLESTAAAVAVSRGRRSGVGRSSNRLFSISSSLGEGGVTPSTHSTELTHDGTNSPSVVRVEASPHIHKVA